MQLLLSVIVTVITEIYPAKLLRNYSFSFFFFQFSIKFSIIIFISIICIFFSFFSPLFSFTPHSVSPNKCLLVLTAFTAWNNKCGTCKNADQWRRQTATAAVNGFIAFPICRRCGAFTAIWRYPMSFSVIPLAAASMLIALATLSYKNLNYSYYKLCSATQL